MKLALGLLALLALTPAKAAAPAGAPAAVLKTPGTKPGERRELTIQGVPMAMRWCPPGKFKMGSPESEPERVKEEAQREVTLTQGFWIAETEVTQALWTALGQRNAAKWKGKDNPADSVLWYEAVEFCNQLSAASGLRPAYAINKETKDPNNKLDDKGDPMKWQVTLVQGADGFRLPTEAQWEYACRAGTTTAFSWGDTINPSQANYNGGNIYNKGEKGPYLATTTPVGKYAANPWGLVDMHGNVWEWCWDWYGPYASGAETDPAGPAVGTLRVIRGGVWHYKPAYLRSTARYKDKPAKRWDLLGFRPVLPVSSGKPQ